MKAKLTRENVMERTKIISQDAVDRGFLNTKSMMMMRWPCNRGAGIDIPFEQIVDAPDELITEAINKLVDTAFEHMKRCRKGCRDV